MNIDSPVAFIRLFSAGVLAYAAFESLLLLAYYWQSIVPIRRMVGEQGVLAPPIRWTFLYHLNVFVTILLMIATLLTLMKEDAPAGFVTYIAPFVAVSLAIVVGRFTKYYSGILRSYRHRLEGLPDD